MDYEHPARVDDVGTAGGGHGMGEHLSRRELHVAVRRIQAVGHRAGERTRRRSRIPANEKRVDRYFRKHTEPVRNAIGPMTAVDDATAAYILETRKAFEDLRQVAAQLSGLLVLEAAGARSELPHHPMLAAAEELWRGASEA